MNKNRLVGGEFLLDLVMISFVASVDSETFTDITNQQVINQLTDLKTYIRNPKSIKPIWVRLQDNDDYIVTRGALSKDKDSNVFVIRVKFKGQLLTINVEFTQMLNEDNQPLDDYYIDSGDAGYNLVSQNNLSSIVDNQGNPRFIEGDITLKDTLPSGIEQLYGKYSLSGSHLLLVLSFSTPNGTTIPTGSIANVKLPKWILDKLYPLISSNIIVPFVTLPFLNDAGAVQNTSIRLDKSSDSVDIFIYTITTTDDRVCRVQFDLLIDTDAPAEEEQGD